MHQVTVSRTVDADLETVRTAMDDVVRFMRAAEFDEVSLDGDRLTIGNTVGLFDIELVLELVESDAELAYEQREGIFESMRTEYHLEPAVEGTTITATTEHEAIDLAVVGPVLDSTLIDRQRRKELTAQFDWLAEEVA